jgi:hypothetical protein
MRKNRVAIQCAATIIGLSAAVVGCGSAADTVQRSTSGEAVSDQAAYTPITTWAFGGQTPGVVHQHIVDIVARCMKSRGWDYAPPVVDATDEPGTVGALRTYRSEHGYGLADAAAAPTAPKPEPLAADLGAAFQRDLGKLAPGSPADGSCSSEGLAAVAATVPMYSSQEVRLAIGAETDTVTTDPDFAAALAKWSTCLEAATGLRAGTLEDPQAHVADERLSGSQLRVEEHRIASADSTCQETSVLPVRVRLESAAVERLKAKYPGYG